MLLGSLLTPLKVTVSGATSSATQVITSANTFANATQNSAPTPVGQTVAGYLNALPPILSVISLRVTAGAATAGPRVVTDVGGTPYAPVGANETPGVATLSDDGTTLVFDTTVTGYVIEYIPRSSASMTAPFLTQPTQ